MQVKDVLQVSDLLKRFPKGFAVTPSGKIFEIITSFQRPDEAYSVAPPRDSEKAWGYLVVAIPIELPQDQERFAHKRIATQDFYRLYENHLFEDKEEVEKVVETLNNVGVGRDHHYTVTYNSEGSKFKLALLGESIGEKV